MRPWRLSCSPHAGRRRCIAAFVDSVWLVSVISAAVLLGYVALNETARELENPFGVDANDLFLTSYQRDFNHKLAALLDLSVPNLGYSVTEAAPL